MRKLVHSLALSICVLAVSILFAVPAKAAPGDCIPYARSNAVVRIIKLESGGDPEADNPKSTAFGCGQLLRGNRIKYGKECGVRFDTLDPEWQMCMTHAYIDDRYKSDEAALAFKLRRGWY